VYYEAHLEELVIVYCASCLHADLDDPLRTCLKIGKLKYFV